MRSDTTNAKFFEHKYRKDADPWDFETSPYEQKRYHAVIESLQGRHFSRAFEPGCSVGVLTSSLAAHCDRLEAIDISPTAVRRAQERCARFPNVIIQQGSLPQAIPSEQFDLILFSEIGYYFDKRQLTAMVQAMSKHLVIGGLLLAAHWLGNSADHLLSGDEVHTIIRNCSNLALDGEWLHSGFRLDRMVRS